MSEMGIEKIGIVGGGQLGRMLTQAAVPLGFETWVIDPNANCPAAQVGANQLLVAGLNDEEAIRELADNTDVLTWEIEHIAADLLVELEREGVMVEPSPATLSTIQDKLRQKEMLQAGGIPVAPFAELGQAEHKLSGRNGYVVKSRMGGYDGRGNLSLDELDLAMIHTKFDKDSRLYVEERLPFDRELAFIAARDRRGSIVPYPVVETVHRDNICHEVLAPAPGNPKIQMVATEVGMDVMKLLEGAGVFAIEMFQVGDEVIVNEIAPRVHNSGHWTIEGAGTSQFEQHIRAITGMPLGDPSMQYRAPAAVMINILGQRDEPFTNKGVERALQLPDTHINFYGKSPRPARKIGHITVLGNTIEEARQIAEAARSMLQV